MKDLLRYDRMVETAMRGVVREAVAQAAAKGLPGAHHFYVTFKTRADGVLLPPRLAEKYPDDMTIVLEHQFWDLEVGDQDFAVTLSFDNRPERLVIPFAGITAFADPSVKFGLQFPVVESVGEAADIPPAPAPQVEFAIAPHTRKPAAKGAKDTSKPAEIVALDAFRKK
ncbi:MAG: SspB family protein [Stellaceae bacterium]